MSAPISHPFTCNTCQVAFRSGELQRTHMQSDWHRYNLKRRVASLPPLSSEIFAEKVLANKASAAATAAKASYERLCEPCAKTYYSENAYVNHLSSHRHRAMASRMQRGLKNEDDGNSVMSSTFLDPSEKASVASTINDDAEDEFAEVVNGIKGVNLEDDDDDPISRRPTRPHHSSLENRPAHPLSPSDSSATGTKEDEDIRNGEMTKEEAIKQCLFCTHIAEDLGESLTHMQKIHGMFIPERLYLVDLEGLILYLARKVHIEYQCLYCNRLKWSEDGIKTHMRDMSHCKIAYDTEQQQLEIGEFYDFRSTYSDSGSETEEAESDEEMAEVGPAVGGGVKLGAKRQTRTKVDDEDSDDASEDGENEGWETDSTGSSVPSEEIGALYNDLDKDTVRSRLQRSKSDSKRHKSADGYHSHAHHNPASSAYYDDYELHLPTGRVAGHRSLNKYFRQNLRSHPTAQERVENEQRMLTERGEGNSSADEVDAQRDAARGRGRDSNRQLVGRANGGLGMLAVTEEKKRQVKAVEKREKRREQRYEAKQQWRTDVKGNSQKHFRDPLLQ